MQAIFFESRRGIGQHLSAAGLKQLGDYLVQCFKQIAGRVPTAPFDTSGIPQEMSAPTPTPRAGSSVIGMARFAEHVEKLP